jgi:hypothetical protein
MSEFPEMICPNEPVLNVKSDAVNLHRRSKVVLDEHDLANHAIRPHNASISMRGINFLNLKMRELALLDDPKSEHMGLTTKLPGEEQDRSQVGNSPVAIV